MNTSCLTLDSITVQIRDNGVTPALGQSYSLACEVSGDNDTIASSAYQWRKNGAAVINNGSTLSFSALNLTDAGQYTCHVTVDGMILNSTTAKNLTLSS